MCSIPRDSSLVLLLAGFIACLTFLTQIELCSTIVHTEKDQIHGDLLTVQLKPSELIHRRITRANSQLGNASRWIPAYPRLQKSLDHQFFDPRGMNFHSQQLPPPPSSIGPQFQQSHTLNRFNPHHQNPVQITRPSQLEPQLINRHPLSSQQYGATQLGTHVPTPGYLPGPGPGPGPSTLINNLNTATEASMNNPSESELRFLFHRPEDENLIKSTILEESQRYNERVTFVRGPTLKFQRRQTIYLPPKKKSVIYIMLKEPQIQTDLEVIEPMMEPTPEVNIIYENAGPVKTKHYYSTTDKQGQQNLMSASNSDHSNRHYSRDLSSIGSEIKTQSVPFLTSTSTTSIPQLSRKSSINTSTISVGRNPCQPNFPKKLRKRR